MGRELFLEDQSRQHPKGVGSQCYQSFKLCYNTASVTLTCCLLQGGSNVQRLYGYTVDFGLMLRYVCLLNYQI